MRFEWRWLQLIGYVLFTTYLIRSALSPRLGEPRKWYDRSIRILGALVLGISAVFGFASLMGWIR